MCLDEQVKWLSRHKDDHQKESKTFFCQISTKQKKKDFTRAVDAGIVRIKD